MPWVQNVSLQDVRNGHHIRVGANSVLIQIVDPDMDWPTPLLQFGQVHQFKFLDVERDDKVQDEAWRISDSQAEQLVSILQQALDNRADVVVHCVAGICRSGAVAEVGVMMGFSDTGRFRSPNLLVKHKLMARLGWTYDEDEPHTVTGNAWDHNEGDI